MLQHGPAIDLYRLPPAFHRGRTAIAAVTVHAHGDNGGVAVVAHFEDLSAVVGEDGERVTPPFSGCRSDRGCRPSLHLDEAGRELDVGVNACEEGVEDRAG